MLVLKFSRH